jgi:hypothetical protein
VTPQEIIPEPNWLPSTDPNAIPYEDDEDDEEDYDYEDDDDNDGDDDPGFGFVRVVS